MDIKPILWLHIYLTRCWIW